MPIKALAAVDLAITVIPGADAAKLLEVGVKGAAKAGGEQAAFALVRWIAGKTDGKVAADLSDNVLRDAFRARKTGGAGAVRNAIRAACALCFPAGTQVATPHGGQAIESLHAGDLVQAENPATGKVEAEAVQAVIQDPVSPLVAVDLSDGSAITVTADHPFWVDAGAQLAGAQLAGAQLAGAQLAGAQLAGAGWFAAGRLQAGDELRTAAGAHVMVVGLRRNVGTAVVYTLTVAKDHTFFVGAAQVLVHNCDGLEVTPQGNGEYVARVPGDPKFFYRVVRSGNGVDVTDTYKGNQTQAGGTILADLLRKAGLSHPSFMRLTNVLNKPTSEALARGTEAKDTVLGKMVQVAVRDLGGKITKWQPYEDLGKLYIEVTIEY